MPNFKLKKYLTVAVSREQEEVRAFINALGSAHNAKGKARFPYCTKRALLDFAKIIDNPHCFNGGLHDLYYCQSTVYGLQKRQRITCVKVMTVLLSLMDVETLQIGIAKHEYMDTVTHQYCMKLYYEFFGETISEKRYHAAIRQLKAADFLVIDAVYLQDRDLLSDLDLTDDQLPKVYSKAAYKSVTPKFMAVFGLDNDESVVKSKLKSIAKRVKAKLSTAWVTWQAFSDSYVWTKRNKAKMTRTDSVSQCEVERYPQRRKVAPSPYGGNYLSEH